jgi:hypothetical protein
LSKKRNLPVAPAAIAVLRFLDNVWLPEELGHAAVTSEFAIRSGGISGSAMNQLISQIKERGFDIGTDYSLIQTDIYIPCCRKKLRDTLITQL